MEEPRSYKLSGELDLSTADQLIDVLAEDRTSAGDVALDLSELAFIDSSGLRVLLDTVRSLGEMGTLVLRRPSGEVARVFEVSGIDQLKGIRVER